MDLEKRSESVGDTLILHLLGELTGPEIAAFKTWSAQELGCKPTVIHVDCGRLHFIDSSGLGALIYLRKLSIEGEASFKLINVSGWLRKFLQVTGLEETFCGDSVSTEG